MEAYSSGGAIVVNEAPRRGDGLLEPSLETIDSENRLVLVEIPANFQEIKAREMDLAVAWRLHIRETSERLFGRKYLVTDFIRNEDEGGAYRSYYVLTKSEEGAAGPQA